MGCGVWGLVFVVWRLGFGVLCLWIWVWGLGFRGLGLGLWGLGFEVRGLGNLDWGLRTVECGLGSSVSDSLFVVWVSGVRLRAEGSWVPSSVSLAWGFGLGIRG